MLEPNPNNVSWGKESLSSEQLAGAKEVKKDDHKPVSMSAVGKTLSFPRADNIFKHKESLPYDEVQTQVWRERPRRGGKDKTRQWRAYFYLGVLIGGVAFLMSKTEDLLSEWFVHNTQTLITNAELNDESNVKRVVVPWLAFAVPCGICGLIASAMTTYWGPGASGSGVAEFIGYCNGVNYPNFISIPTLITKIVGTTLAVVGRLCVGKEGPLAHIGAICGIAVLYIPG